MRTYDVVSEKIRVGYCAFWFSQFYVKTSCQYSSIKTPVSISDSIFRVLQTKDVAKWRRFEYGSINEAALLLKAAGRI
jgi:hypothetical protein